MHHKFDLVFYHRMKYCELSCTCIYMGLGHGYGV